MRGSSINDKRVAAGLGIGCLTILVMIGVVTAVASMVADAPALPYLLVGALGLGIVGLIRNRPAGLRGFVFSNAAWVFAGIVVLSLGSR